MARVIPEWVRRARRGTTGKRTGFRHGFRSGLEVKIGEQLEAHGLRVVYEEYKLPYVVPESRHLYTWDFTLPNGIIVEAKGIFDSTDRAKHLLVKAQYPDLDIRFVFTRSAAKIGPGAKSTLADWCDKHGYRYADKLIPEAWLKEAGPERNPLDVIKAGPYGYTHWMSLRPAPTAT